MVGGPFYGGDEGKRACSNKKESLDIFHSLSKRHRMGSHRLEFSSPALSWILHLVEGGDLLLCSSFLPPLKMSSTCKLWDSSRECWGTYSTLKYGDINADTDIDDPFVQVQRSGVIDDRVEVSVLCWCWYCRPWTHSGDAVVVFPEETRPELPRSGSECPPRSRLGSPVCSSSSSRNTCGEKSVKLPSGCSE